ncbi:hypothetical protein ACFWJQ_30525 [Streptomyces goshikiensis]|uniref:hypothetical protein n=1 Tax=Streptomyces goshikiensis TaxID=1942 RepID=UPI0036603E75
MFATAFPLALALDFLIWRRTEGTPAVETVADGRREVFHWTVVMATFALGAAVGDLTAASLGRGYLLSGLLTGPASAPSAAASGWAPVRSAWSSP